MTQRPSLQVAVVMRRERVPGDMSRWQPWRWVLHDVTGHDVLPHAEHFGSVPRCMRQTDDEQMWLHPGFTVELFKDDAEGYELNASSPAPCWFVLWRMEEEPGISSERMAVPTMVSLSYHDAGRWLDAQENVDQVPAPAEVVAWMKAFIDEHLVVEAKRRRRPESFRTLQDRFGNPASVSTEKNRGGGQHNGGGDGQ
ncbi:DUF3305 domain-containing protein [Rhodoferax sp. OV413]|uniref:DUF3305 domain-containing protein n=1 Tax=Rhodoferax sp. OV413 TaxID=1855285 RepID=UPI0025FA3C4B|nr:DUF3305 domain-containing protein [Rhodoferax sp. OV413]